VIRLIIVTVALAAVAVALRMRSGSATKTDRLRVTARTALHRGAAIAVVEVDGRRLLIGAGSQHVGLIAELDPVPPTAAHRRPERPSELPAVPEVDATLVDRFRRATTRTLDPTRRARPHHRPVEPEDRRP
jgi:flagellar biogenesis protein FliO